jgi:hypothetical protein
MQDVEGMRVVYLFVASIILPSRSNAFMNELLRRGAARFLGRFRSHTSNKPPLLVHKERNAAASALILYVACLA